MAGGQSTQVISMEQFLSKAEEVVELPRADHLGNHSQALFRYPPLLAIQQPRQQFLVGEAFQLGLGLLAFVDLGEGLGFGFFGGRRGADGDGVFEAGVHDVLVVDDVLDQLQLFLVDDLMVLVQVVIVAQIEHSSLLLQTLLDKTLQAYQHAPPFYRHTQHHQPDAPSKQKLDIVRGAHPRSDLVLLCCACGLFGHALSGELGRLGSERKRQFGRRRPEVAAFDNDTSELLLLGLVGRAFQGVLIIECCPQPEDFLDGAVDLLVEFCALLGVGGRLFGPALALLVEVELGVVDGHLFSVPKLLLQSLPCARRCLLLSFVDLADQQDRLRLWPLLPLLSLSCTPFLLMPGQTREVVVEAPLPLLSLKQPFFRLLFLLLFLLLLEDAAGEAFAADGGRMADGEVALEAGGSAVFAVVGVVLVGGSVADAQVAVGGTSGLLAGRREDGRVRQRSTCPGLLEGLEGKTSASVIIDHIIRPLQLLIPRTLVLRPPLPNDPASLHRQVFEGFLAVVLGEECDE